MESGAKTHKDSRRLGEQFRDFGIYFKDRKHAKALFSVCIVWFLLLVAPPPAETPRSHADYPETGNSDIAFYGINLNQAVIISRIGYGKGPTTMETLWNTAVGNVIVQSAGYLPGFYIAIFLPDTLGRKRQQLICCLTVSIFYAIWAGITNHATTGGLMAIFTLSQLVLNAGPNATTFLLPVELFPTRVRATAHGIAAASGKAGAVLTAFAFGSVVNAIGTAGVLGLFSGIMALCALATTLVPETKGCSLEDLEEDVLYYPRLGSLAEDSAMDMDSKDLSVPSVTVA